MSDSFVTTWTLAWQALLSIAFPKQEYWSRSPVPSPGGLPDSETEHVSCVVGRFLTTEPPGKPRCDVYSSTNNKYIYFHLGILKEKAMAPHSSTLAWQIPWTEEPGGLQSMGTRRVGHD